MSYFVKTDKGLIDLAIIKRIYIVADARNKNLLSLRVELTEPIDDDCVDFCVVSGNKKDVEERYKEIENRLEVI